VTKTLDLVISGIADPGRSRPSHALSQPASTRPATTLAASPARSQTPVWERTSLRRCTSIGGRTSFGPI